MYVVLVTTRTKNHALLKESFSLERLSLILRLPDSRWKPAMLTYDPHCSPLLWCFFLSCYAYSVILTVTQYLDFHCLVQKTCDCHLLWRLSEGEKTDTIYSSEHVQWDAFFTSVFVMISAVFCCCFFHGQIVWNLFIVGKLVEKKAASEMISFIAFFPSNLIPVPGLLFNAHMKC